MKTEWRNPAAERRVLGFDVGCDHVWAHAGSRHYDGPSADDLLPALWNQESSRRLGKAILVDLAIW